MITLDIKKLSKLAIVLDAFEFDDMDQVHLSYKPNGLFCRLPNSVYLEWDTVKERWYVVSGY